MPAPSLLSNRNMRRLGQDPTTTHFKHRYDRNDTAKQVFA